MQQIETITEVAREPQCAYVCACSMYFVFEERSKKKHEASLLFQFNCEAHCLRSVSYCELIAGIVFERACVV